MKKLGLLLVLMLSGCSASYNKVINVRGYMPEYPLPPKPKLEKVTGAELSTLSPEVKAKLVGNSDKLQIYSKQLESTIELHNAGAKKHNEATGKALGLGKGDQK